MHEHSTFDVAVIGGGLAGLSLAIQCADRGYHAVLFEKESYPFHKVCGEYISMESWGFLERLHIPLSAMDLPLINQLQISDVSGRLYNFKLPLGGFGISRHLLDDALCKIAVEKGVKVFCGCRVNDVKFENDMFTITTQQGDFFSIAALGSFGKRSNIDVKLSRPFIHHRANKLNNYIGVKYHVRYPQPKNTITLHNFYKGYCGISNIEGDKCCLCYFTTAGNLKSSGNSIKSMEKEVLEKNPALKKIFSEAEFLYQEPLTISQISFRHKSKIQEHILMTGDAAGMITPLCGNGMSMALNSSKIAFGLIDSFLQRNISRRVLESSYVKQWTTAFEKRLWMGRQVQRFFGGETSTALFLRTMQALPPLAKMVINSTHGKPF